MNANASASIAETYDELHDGTPGRIRYYRFGDEPPEGEPAGLLFSCPCGCGLIGSVVFRRHPVTPKSPVWTWNGDRERPTCTPSIGFYGANERSQGHHWHGFLTDGEFRGCP